MPQFGTLDLAARRASVPSVTELAKDAWDTAGAEILHLGFEIDQADALALIPAALHPSIPPYATLLFRHHPTSPVGPFRLAEVRITTRAGVHYGGFVTGAYVDNQAAVGWLRERYGWPVTLGKVDLRREHHRTVGRVESDGRTILEVALERAVPISPADILYVVNLHLAQVGDKLRLVQVEPEYTFEYAERGRSSVHVFDAAAFGEPRLQLTTPLPATYTRSTVHMREIRYLIDPTKPAIAGTEPVSAAA